MARVFDKAFQNGERYYKNTIPGLDGTTEATSLIQQLKNEFAQVKPGDKGFFIFNGHGGYNEKDTSKNTLKLWNDTSLTAQELMGLLDTINSRATVRVFLPQCFSGGFAHAFYSRQSGSNNICGFMSVSENKIAEGCSSSIDVGDYRDYTTYFFAALDGQSRLGKPLLSDPDLDKNGTVTLREAHFYSLVNGESTDVPRTTSEVYLQHWQPWYLRLFHPKPAEDNVYWKLVKKLATRLNLPTDNTKMLLEAKTSIDTATAESNSLSKQQKANRKEIQSLQASIQNAVLARWPEARFPYTNNYRLFMMHGLPDAQKFITQLPGYTKLVNLQEQQLVLDGKIMAANRKRAQFEKLLRMNKIAVILDRFTHYSSEKDMDVYRQLVTCEDTRL